MAVLDSFLHVFSNAAPWGRGSGQPRRLCRWVQVVGHVRRVYRAHPGTNLGAVGSGSRAGKAGWKKAGRGLWDLGQQRGAVSLGLREMIERIIDISKGTVTQHSENKGSE